jgi:hypothetical protein
MLQTTSAKYSIMESQSGGWGQSSDSDGSGSETAHILLHVSNFRQQESMAQTVGRGHVQPIVEGMERHRIRAQALRSRPKARSSITCSHRERMAVRYNDPSRGLHGVHVQLRYRLMVY